MKFKLLAFILFATFLTGLLLVQRRVLAAVRCETQYGGGEVCVRTGNLQINKKIVDPRDGSLKDNLANADDPKFAPGKEVTFKLFIKNVGDAKFDKVRVTDTLPAILELSSGDLSFDITDLREGEVVEATIVAKVVSSDRFPVDQNLVCDVNTAEAVSGDSRDKDTARICARKQVLGAAPTPVTGPENWVYFLAFSAIAGSIGLLLLKPQKVRFSR